MYACLLLIVLALLVTSACPAAETVTCGPFRLGFDAASGQWRSLALGNGANLLGSAVGDDVRVTAEGQPWPETGWQALPIVVHGGVVSVTRTSGPWTVTSTFRAAGNLPRLQRRVRLTWGGTAPVAIRAVELRVPGVTMAAPDASWSLPGTYPVQTKAIAASFPGQVSREPGWTWADTGVCVLRSPKTGQGLLLAYTLEDDHARVQVEEGEKAVTPGHRFETIVNAAPGDPTEVGTQWLQVTTGGLTGLRKAAQDLAAVANGGPPPDRPKWLAGATIVELHPWGRLEAWAPGDRGDRMPSLEAQLPHLRDLGADAVWLLPVSNKPPWVYFLPTFRNIDPQVTTPEQLRSFIAAGHRLGVRTLMDLVTYGINPDSPDVASLPDQVWCRNQQGQQEKAWGGTVLAADLCEPAWRDHIVDLTSWWVREFGADGYRLDCGGCGQALNWQPRHGRHVSATGLAGGIEQNAAIRTAIRRLNPDAVLMPEAGATPHFRSSDLLFDYPLYMICRELTREPDPAQWVARLREWLEAQRLTHSPLQLAGMVRFLENHDTVAAQDYFGAGPSQALTALCVFIPGTFLWQQEEETGFAPALRQWLRLRHERSELRTGEADYTAMKTDQPSVFAFTRTEAKATSVVAINFSPEPVRCRLRWDKMPRACVNAVSGQAVDPAAVTIPPYAPVLLVPTAARETARAAAAKPTQAALVRETTTSGTRTEIKLAPMARWFVATGEGLLEDDFIDLHRGLKPGETHVDATPPLARCWRPLEHGLWDTCAEPSLGGVTPDGRMVEVIVTARDRVQRVRLEDPSSHGESAAIVIEAMQGPPPFRVIERPDAARRLNELRLRPTQSTLGPVTVDPLWVRARNSHYIAALSRRHGGTLSDLHPAGVTSSWIDHTSEIYTDWGLFAERRHVSSDGETNPRLDLQRQGDATLVTFRGRLYGPSWNGVQTAPVEGPRVNYRLTYRFDASPTIGVAFGLTPTTDRPATKAFFAYRIPFAGLDAWMADDTVGQPGRDPGKRVWQGGDLGPALAQAALSLHFATGILEMSAIRGEPLPPQNPFLLDSRPGSMCLFFAMLNGGELDLKTGEERTASFDLTVR